MKNASTYICGIMLLAAAAYAELCTYYSSTLCQSPVYGSSQVGDGICPKCYSTVSKWWVVNSNPTKTWAKWDEVSGKTGYDSGTTVCCTFFSEDVTCPYCGRSVNIRFTISGTPEQTTWPSGNACPTSN